MLEIIRQQAEEIQQLKDEINIHKNNPRKPKIKPSSLEKKNKAKSKGERPGSAKKSKTAQLTIQNEKEIEPDGNHVVGKLPEYLNGKPFGLALIRLVLYQHCHCHVTQPLLLEQLYEMGVVIFFKSNTLLRDANFIVLSFTCCNHLMFFDN